MLRRERPTRAGLKQVNARQYTLWDLYAAADESQVRRRLTRLQADRTGG